MSGWVIGWMIGAVVVVVVVVLLLLMIKGAARAAAKAESVLAALDEAKARNNKSARKKLGVGLARQFIVDWWRIRTGRTTPEKLGLKMSWPTAYVLRGKAPTAIPPADAKVAA